MRMIGMMKIKNFEFFAIQNEKDLWYCEWVDRDTWRENFYMATIYTRMECATYKIESLAENYPSKPIPKLIKFTCYESEHVNFVSRTKNNKKNMIGNCKFCGVPGFKSDQGGIDGIPNWEVYASHKRKCPVIKKGHLQGEITWVSLSDWKNFYKE